MTHLIATFFYVGHLRPAPGTWGSLAALPAAFVLLWISPWALMIAIPVVFFGGLWATRIETAGKDDHDPSEIVIDEVAGQWIALLPITIATSFVGVAPLAMWPGWVAAFLLFRLFDITKIGPIGTADRRGDAMGVMLDDVIAGVFAAIGVVLIGGAFHMYF